MSGTPIFEQMCRDYAAAGKAHPHAGTDTVDTDDGVEGVQPQADGDAADPEGCDGQEREWSPPRARVA